VAAVHRQPPCRPQRGDAARGFGRHSVAVHLPVAGLGSKRHPAGSRAVSNPRPPSGR
jgi:hypothetical protein